MFGMGTTVASDQVSGAQALINVISLLSEPDRKTLAAELQKLAKGMEQIQAARAELTRFEARLLQRERTCEAAEAASAKRSADLDERVQQVQGMQMRAEQGIAELAALKADLKSKIST
jgi:CII-binding regulator of phage lambda lysogenization HflD